MPVTLSAARTTSLFNDQDSDGRVDLGDTLFIRLEVSNTGDTDAQNAVINDALTGQTLVAGSINISPLAVNDVFNAVGNTQFLVGGAVGTFSGPSASFAGNLLSNDSNLAGDNFPGFTLTSIGNFATSGAGSVTINADGSFSYNPAAGFSGADTFTYTLRDAGQDGIAGNSDDLTSTATVTINITIPNTVWYVDQAYDGSNGASNGTSWRPFTSMAQVNGAGGAGDLDVADQTIYVRGNHTVDVVLESGQSLIGNGAALTVGGYNIASAGAANTLTHSTGTGILLNSNNTLSGFNVVGNNAAGIGIADNGSVGTLNISSVNVTGTGKAIDIDSGGTLNVVLGTLSSSSSASEGVHLQGVSGSFTASTGAIQTSSGVGFLIGASGGGTGSSGGNANITYGGDLTSNGGASIDIQDRTGGTVTFNGAITEGAGAGIVADGNSGNINFGGQIFISSGASNAITLTNNAAAIAFTPTGTGLDITTTTGIGFRADGGGGSVTITGLANSVQTGSGRAVEIDNVTIGGAGITFQTVGMTDGGSATGIFLNNAGSGGFTITGSGTTAASGGTINSIDSGSDGNVEQGIGIYINNTNNIVLQNMAFTGDFANFGIRGTNVNNFTLRDSTANSASADNGGFGNSNAADEGVISFDNLTGTALFTGNNLSDGHEDIIVIENTTGTLNLTVNDSAANQAVIGRNGEQFGSATGNDGILVTTTGSAALTMNVTGVVFEGWRGDGIQVDARGASTANVTIANNTFHNAHLDITSAGGGAVFLGISAGTGAGPSLTYAITGNSIRGAEGSAIVASALGPSGSMSGTILNNTIGFNDGVHSAAQATTGANQGGHGIFVRAEKDGTGGTLTHAVRIENNDIGDITTGAGIFLLANGDGAAGAGTSRLEATILNNRIDELGVNAYAGINSTVGGAGGADDALMGINFQSNNINMSGATNAVAGLIFDDLASTAAFYFPGYNGPYDDAGLAAFHTGPEGNTINVAGTFASQVITSPTGTIGFNANFVLPVPLLAAAPPVDNWEAAIRAAQQQALDAWLAGQSGDGGAAGGDAGDSGGGETGGGAGAIADDGILTPAELAIFVEAAIQRWIAAGATEAQVAAMRATEIGVADLGGLYIGTSSPGIIVLDDNAAGHNWYLDTTPEADEEYSLQNGELRADPNTTAGSRVDLLTAIMHELGHQIGLEDEYGAGDANDLMFGFINPGERHLPGEEEVASADGTPVDYTALALGAVGFGTIQAGTTRQISWQTTYDGPGTNQLVPTLNNSSSVTYNNGGGDIVVNSNTNTLSTASALALDSLTLGGGIWIDDGAGGGTRGDGIRNGTEGGISGVAITLFADTNGDNVWDAGDTQLATTTSGLGGLYSFAGLAPGNYIVRVDQGNFAAVLSPYQTSSVTTPEPIDPDDNALNDDNGSRSPGDAAYSQAITLSHGDEPITDGDADPDTNLTLDFGFLAINAAPTSGSIDGDTVTFTEGQPLAALLDLGPNATIADSDSANFDGGTLTVEISGGLVAAEDRLLIRLTGTVSFNATAVFVNGTQIGTYTGANSSGPLVITFDADATPAAVAELFRAIAYNNIGGDNPTDGNRTITWTLVDGDGTASGGSDTLLITSTVNVDPVDDPGSAGADSETVAENATVDIAVLTNDSDVDGPAPVVAEVDGNPIAEGGSVLLASGALVTRNADGTLTYDPNGAFDATPRADSGASNTPSADSFTYTLAGGGTATVTMTITGVDSDDLLIDTPVNDELIGGIGDDIYSVRNNGDTLVELPGGGTDTVRTDLAAYILNAANIENLTGILNTSQVLVGNALDNRIEGGTGNDQMQGRAGNDTYVVRNSGDTLVEQVGEGTDTVETDLAIYILNAANVENLTGTVNTGQVLVGNGLDNRITGGTGNDTLQGRLGDDTYVLRNSGDTIVEQVGEGNDTIETDLAVYVLRAANVENLVGTSSGGQVLLGSAGNDRIMGDIGNDTLYGRDGDDTFVIQNSGDTIVETAGGGTDTVETALNFYFLNAANVENLTFTGVGDFYGAGNASDNVITGGAGNDILRGGLGADTLVGGAGVDRYLFDSALGGGNVDAITGFVSAFDRILLEDSIFTALAPGGLPAGAFVAGTAALDADDRIIYDSATGALFYDADGNGAGAAVQFASLGAGTVLTANDFAVI